MFSYDTWGGSTPIGKPKLFFSCYHEDFHKYFDRIREDVFRAYRDCVIHYTIDMTVPISEEDKQTTLQGMSLFIIPVSYQLLVTHNRTIDEDIPFALKHNIPVLPIMLEPNLEDLYSQPNRFGALHFLSLQDNDGLGLDYQEKLKRYLEKVLISKPLYSDIRKAFDASLFMSYMHEDLTLALEFMRKIHKISLFRDLAIWYDDFLIPGKAFDVALDEKIKECDLFALIITKNINDDQNNYALTNEYPTALAEKKPILCVEMDSSEKKNLEVIAGLRVDAKDEDALQKAVKSLLGDKQPGRYLDDPQQQFLMGAAYLWGVDVEVDRERAVDLLKSAGEKEDLNAEKLLHVIYGHGMGVPLDYGKEVYWGERYANHCKERLGEEDPYTISALRSLADSYHHVGRYKDEIKVWNSIYELKQKTSGEDTIDTLGILSNIAANYDALGEYDKALELCQIVQRKISVIPNEETSTAIIVIGNLANIYYDTGDLPKAIEMGEEACERASGYFGKKDRYTLFFENNQAFFLIIAEEFEKAEILLADNYEKKVETLGPTHPETIDTIDNQAFLAGQREDYDNALELELKAYKLRKDSLGENHPSTIRSLIALMKTCSNTENGLQVLEELIAPMKRQYEELCKEKSEADSNAVIAREKYIDVLLGVGQYPNALAVLKKAYARQYEELGANHTTTLSTMYEIGGRQIDMGLYGDAIDTLTKCYDEYCKSLGVSHENTIKTLMLLAAAYERDGKEDKAFEADEKAYDSCLNVFDEKHPLTLHSLSNLGAGYYITGNTIMAEKCIKKAYEMKHKVFGEKNPSTISSLKQLGIMLIDTNASEALDYLQRVYAVQKKEQGRNDPEVQHTLYSLARCNMALGNYQQAKLQSQSVFTIMNWLFPKGHPLASLAYALHTAASYENNRYKEENAKSVLDMISMIKTERKYEKLLIGKDAKRAAQDAVCSYASNADLSHGFAIEQTRRRRGRFIKSRGILFTENGVYSNQLPSGGIRYIDIESVRLIDITVFIYTSDSLEYKIELGDSGQNVFYILKNASFMKRRRG